MVKPRKMHRTPSCSAASKALFGQAAGAQDAGSVDAGDGYGQRQ